MRPEYALAKATPEISSYAARMPGGVLVTWEASDAGWAMAGAPKWASDLVMCKWGGAAYSLSIPIGAGNIAAQEIRPGAWGIIVAHAAAREIIASRQCPTCDGRGIVKSPDSDLLEDCEACEATGATQWDNAQRADIIGVTEQEFRRQYYQFHKECLRVLVRGELETLSSMAYRLNK